MSERSAAAPRPEASARPAPGAIAFRRPTPEAAAAVWQLVERTPSLDGNSPYAYLLLCSHFADTGVIAWGGDELLGFVLGYARPDDAATAFVWQVAVDERARGQGLASRLLDAWFARCARRQDIRFLEATVTPSNQASRSLFASFARRRGVALREESAYPGALFPPGQPHEDEVALRIGPIPLPMAFASVPSRREGR